MFITNTFGPTFDLTSYEITSSSGSLNVPGWTSLDEQENEDPIGIGWEKAGGSSPNVLAEVNLQSSSSLDNGGSLSLGNAFMPGATQDLRFQFTTAEGEVLRGIVQYVTTGDGSVDAADYVVWRNTLGQNVAFGGGADGDGNGVIEPADYNVWRSNFGMGAGPASAGAASVPEPATWVLLLLSLFAPSGPRAVAGGNGHYAVIVRGEKKL